MYICKYFSHILHGIATSDHCSNIIIYLGPPRCALSNHILIYLQNPKSFVDHLNAQIAPNVQVHQVAYMPVNNFIQFL